MPFFCEPLCAYTHFFFYFSAYKINYSNKYLIKNYFIYFIIKLWTAETFIFINKLVGLCITLFIARDFNILISAKKANTKISRRINNKRLNLYYVTGLIDANGYFSILCIRNKKMKLGWVLRLNFQIKLSIRDKELLVDIKDALGGAGVITNNTKDSCLNITSLSEIVNNLIPHFDKYSLLTIKRQEFELFKQVVLIMEKKQHLTEEGFYEILSIKAAMHNGLTKALAENFPKIVPVRGSLTLFNSASNSDKQESLKNIDPNWIVGFTEGKGSFRVEVKESSTAQKIVKLNFQIIQNESDKELLTLIILYLNCGTIKIEEGSAPASSTGNKIITVTNFEDIYNIIIPFFQKFPLQGIKRLDLDIFIKVAELIKNEANLTTEGLKRILLIKSGKSAADLITFLDSDSAMTPYSFKSSPLNLAKNIANNNEQLDPWFITGFVESEGSFKIVIVEDQRMLTGYRVLLIFSIGLHVRDKAVLVNIQQTLGCGKITIHGPQSVQLQVSSKQDIEKIIQHFDNYPLITQKCADYELWKNAFELIKKGDHLTQDGLNKIVALKVNQNLGLTTKLS